MALQISGSSIGPLNSPYYGGGYHTSGFRMSKGGNPSWQQMPGGFIIQSGSNTTSGTGGRFSTYVSFPFSFPTDCVAVIVNEGGAAGWGSPATAATAYAVTSKSSSGFYLQGAWLTASTAYYAAGLGANWIAIGY